MKPPFCRYLLEREVSVEEVDEIEYWRERNRREQAEEDGENAYHELLDRRDAIQKTTELQN